MITPRARELFPNVQLLLREHTATARAKGAMVAEARLAAQCLLLERHAAAIHERAAQRHATLTAKDHRHGH